jgi:hypothetical protein
LVSEAVEAHYELISASISRSVDLPGTIEVAALAALAALAAAVLEVPAVSFLFRRLFNGTV